jgi:caspase domain-containing protein
MRLAGVLLLYASALVLTSAPAFASKRVALVAGIDQYDNLPAQQQLKKAVNDANALGNTLRDLGYQVIRANNADRRGFNESWQKFLSLVEPGDEAAFFFAGHGVEIAGQNYLLPRDVPEPKSGETLLIKNESLSVTQLLGDLQDESPRVSLVILDACRDNPFAAGGTRSVGGTRGLARVEAPEGSFVMYSAGTGQTALDRLSDNDDNPNSVFTRSLVPLLKTKGLGMQDVALKVREQVVALANSAGHKQTPAYYDQVIGRFCMAGCEGGDVAAVEPQTTAVPPAAPVPAAKPVPTTAAASCALKDAIFHTARAEADSLAFVTSQSEESISGLDMVLKAPNANYRFELVIENGTGNEYAVLSGQGDNEDPPSSELISVVNGNESPGVGSLEAGAPEQILLPDLQKSFMKQNGGPNAEGYVPSGTLWQRTCPGATTVAVPGAAVGYAWKAVGIGDCGGRDVSCSKASEPSPSECNAARLGQIAVCWTAGHNKGYPGFPQCQGSPKDWCTYKNVAPEQCRGGSHPGEMWVCVENGG